MIKICPEYSTQPNAQKPNPMLRKALEYLVQRWGYPNEKKVAEQGCGALRHLKQMLETFDYIYLIDTKQQFDRSHTIEGVKTTIPDYVKSLQLPNKQVVLMANTEFLATSISLDAIFNICTFDVNLPETRIGMLKAARRNLNENGYFILIIARNDDSILSRCTTENRYSDGYYFKHHGTYTFFTNFKNHDSLVELSSKFGFHLTEDLSIYRQVCLIFTIKK